MIRQINDRFVWFTQLTWRLLYKLLAWCWMVSFHGLLLICVYSQCSLVRFLLETITILIWNMVQEKMGKPIYLSIYLSTLYLTIYLSIHLSDSINICLYIYLIIYLPRLLDDNYEFDALLSTSLMVNQSGANMNYLLEVFL